MYQQTIFDGPQAVRTAGSRQAVLGFRGFTDDGRRGEPSAWFVDSCLTLWREGRNSGRPEWAGHWQPLSLTAIQAGWDARRSAEQTVEAARHSCAVDWIVGTARGAIVWSEPTPQVAPQAPTVRPALALPAPRAILSLPAPESLAARHARLQPMSQRAAARALGVPISTLRDALGLNRKA